jgi:hypothetical protein
MHNIYTYIKWLFSFIFDYFFQNDVFISGVDSNSIKCTVYIIYTYIKWLFSFIFDYFFQNDVFISGADSNDVSVSNGIGSSSCFYGL